MIPALLQLKDRFELVAVASRDATKAESFAKEFGCQAVTGYAALIAREDVDALYVPLPTGLHLKWVGRAIAAGKHVYVEKSFASALVESETLIDAARDAGVAAMEGYMFLYHRQQATVGEWLRDGAIGELRHFHGSFGFPPLPEDDFRYDDTVGGGALMDAAGYPLRAAYLFLGRDLQVRAASVWGPRECGTIIWGSAYLTSQAGVGASIAFGFDNFYQCRYELWGSRGKIAAERAYTPGPSFSPRLVLETVDGSRELLVEPDDHFVAALNEFARIIDEPERREEHYKQIVAQSQSLQTIRTLVT
jgi:dTDP-3,4-didehydro-2,6-dideoxy-alpha-D-glucose 3-reductase